MTLKSCCISGVRHEGEALGAEKLIGGVNTYVTLPSGEYDKTKALIFCSDIFGLPLLNTKLLADDFARNGYATYVPDYLQGDAVPVEEMNAGKFDVRSWLAKHTPETVQAPLDSVLTALKAEGVTQLASTGHCFGAKYTVALLVRGDISCGLVHHPSLLAVPEDFHAIKSSGKPMLWSTCTDDIMFGNEAQTKLVEVMGEDKNFVRNHFEGVQHGWTVRGDLSNPVVKKAKEDAFEKSVEFLKEHF